jgi:hypothetical protein
MLVEIQVVPSSLSFLQHRRTGLSLYPALLKELSLLLELPVS